MQDFCRMVTATVKILILVTVYTVTVCTTQCNADAVKIASSGSKCPEGPSSKLLPHETDCSLFYMCLHGKALLKKCPSNLQFNRHTSVCDHPQNVDCQTDKLGREITDQCPREIPDQPVLLPHQKDCGKFYICDAGVPRLKSCQPGLHFNPSLHTCDYPEKAGCDSGINKKGRDGSDVLCPLNEDGNPILRRHETDCRKFYTCSNGITLVHVCQHGLHFNAELQQCDYPEKAGCEKGVTKVPKGKSGKEIPEDKCPLRQDGKPVLTPHETDCSKFYICNEGFPRLLTCQSGLHFNPVLQACDYPETAGCETGINKKGRDGSNILCPLNEDGNPILRPHETDCRKFYTCNNGITLAHVCQHGLHFNAELQQCDYPEKAGCEKGINKKGRDGSNILCPLNEDGNPILRRHETDCRKFYTCSNGITLVHVCQHGLHFNAELQQCDYPEKAGCEKGIPKKEPKGKTVGDDVSNVCSSVSAKKTVMLPHPTDCSKFFICDSGVSHQKSCPAGLHFSTRLQACDYPSNVQCGKSKEISGILRSVGEPSPYCPEVSGKIYIFYRHPSNCSIYYLCNHGLAYEFVCPARLHFNLRQKRCDYEDVAMCPTGSSRKND